MIFVKEEDAGEEDDEEIFELVETIHFAMFFVIVIFLVQVLAEVRDGLKIQKDWIKWVSRQETKRTYIILLSIFSF